jgi:Helix-turn-helix domain
MAQLLLPIFPEYTKLITPSLGVCEKNNLVTYFHCGMPIYSHGVDELNKFRFTTSNFILQGLCKGSDIERAFHVSVDSIRRWKKRLLEEGEEAFFNEDKRHGKSHKLLPNVLERIQQELDKGRSVNSVAKDEGISEGSIRYAIDKGRLKKRLV